MSRAAEYKQMKQEVSCTYQVTYIVSEYNQSKQDDAYYGIGSCLLRMEKYAESLHFFNKAIQFDDENPDYWISNTNFFKYY